MKKKMIIFILKLFWYNMKSNMFELIENIMKDIDSYKDLWRESIWKDNHIRAVLEKHLLSK